MDEPPLMVMVVVELYPTSEIAVLEFQAPLVVMVKGAFPLELVEFGKC